MDNLKTLDNNFHKFTMENCKYHRIYYKQITIFDNNKSIFIKMSDKSE